VAGMSNRLADETSPYLRQHADNPVDWYPWSDEAFARAKAEDKPVLLSVGYSACHWCHVMAHESFEDDATAALMNQRFVNIKVDREERPDVDAIYMEAVQAMSGHGGWPMTVFLMPDGRPFFGGTYFPRERRGQMLTFTELLDRITEVWHTRRSDLNEQAGEMTEAIGQTARIEGSGERPGLDAVQAGLDGLASQFDPTWGGFGGAPKFPQTMSLELVLRAHAHTGADDALTVVTTSLDAMAAGGIYDHLGGGFARYSVDERWLVPHFEKMLYDQALLARVYLHAWQVTGHARYRQVLDETIAYVLRELRTPEGGFTSAEDADSPDEHGHGVEGEFYVWTPEGIRTAVGDPALAAAAIDWWGVTDEGNFEGRTILHRPLGAELIRPDDVEEARRRLFAAREQRPRPGLDDKVLAEWNGLMLATLAEAAAATGDAGWLAAARANGEHLLARLRRADGRWLRVEPRPGSTELLAYAADHGALLDAFTRLYEATGEARWVTEARAVADALLDLFWDDERGGVFTTGADAPQLVTRPKDVMDGAVPSANSLAAAGLLRLAALTGEDRYHARGVAILDLLGAVAGKHPTAFAHLLGAVHLEAVGPTEIAVAGAPERRGADQGVAELVAAVARRYLPNAVRAWGEPFPSPLWEGRSPGPDGRARAYVCRDFACQAPVQDVDALLAQLTPDRRI
jgi:uncharacterized protein YyaL (SSP411 family)